LTACVLDTDVVIAALDRRDAHHPAASSVVSGLIDDGVELCISTINYAEALARPAENDETLSMAVDAIAALGVRVIAPTAAIAVDAARYRAMNVSLADGFALATARAHRAHAASFDRRVRRAMAELDLALPEGMR
jgi:predicted nucleic acid-binding protein